MHPLVKFDDLQTAVKEGILQKAEGVFLLAEVQLGYLERQARISKNAIRRALEIIPKTVYDFYDDIMECLLTPNGPLGDLALRAIMFVAYAVRSLRP